MIQGFQNGSINASGCSAYLLKRSSFKEIELISAEPDSVKKESAKRENLIVCRFCGNKITSPEEIIEMMGKHSHTFSNPSGNTFTIGCFSSAGGCFNFGEPTTEFTWFSGFTWCYAICSACSSHLGWFYRSDKISFYGLILKNLMKNN